MVESRLTALEKAEAVAALHSGSVGRQLCAPIPVIRIAGFVGRKRSRRLIKRLPFKA